MKTLLKCEKCKSNEFKDVGKFYLCQVCGQTYKKEEYTLPGFLSCNHCGEKEFIKSEYVELMRIDGKIVEKNKGLKYLCSRCGREVE